MYIPVQNLRASYMDSVLELSNKYFGYQYLTKHLFEQDNQYISFQIADSQLIAFSIVSINTINELELETGLKLAQKSHDSKQVAFRRHTVVHENFRNLGVAQKFIKESLTYFKSKTSGMYATVWNKSKENTMNLIFDKFGFESLCLIENFWAEDSIRRRYICKECQIIPCQCAAFLRFKSF